MSLSDFYFAFFKVILLPSRNDAPSTEKQYRTSVHYWTAFTADPPLALIDEYTCAAFLERIYELPGHKGKASRFTIHRHISNIRAILRQAGPRSEQCPNAQRLIPEVPFLERPKLDHSPVHNNVTLDELARILEACRIAKAPRIPHVASSQWWRSLIVVAYNTGERRGALLEAEFDKIIDRAIEFPAITRKGRTKTHTVPLNAAALEAIEQVRGWFRRRRIFPWTYHIRHFDHLYKNITEAAGVNKTFHGLRKAAATEMARATADRRLATLLLGHGRHSTTNDFYIADSLKQDELRRAVEAIPQPRPSVATDRQLTLF
ncbi:MAG TPA: tyrosine-type recombinase/integrase [Pirellulales bacterium]|jgi:site-specific recombinase XerD|nr:tyrosine-type recombinase/integrase [Pirellulales bacterium]